MYTCTSIACAPHAPQSYLSLRYSLRRCVLMFRSDTSCAACDQMLSAVFHGRDIRFVPLYGKAPAHTATGEEHSLAELRKGWHRTARACAVHDCCERHNRLTALLNCTGVPVQARGRVLSCMIVAGATHHSAELDHVHLPASMTERYPVFWARSP